MTSIEPIVRSMLSTLADELGYKLAPDELDRYWHMLQHYSLVQISEAFEVIIDDAHVSGYFPSEAYLRRLMI